MQHSTNCDLIVVLYNDSSMTTVWRWKWRSMPAYV